MKFSKKILLMMGFLSVLGFSLKMSQSSTDMSDTEDINKETTVNSPMPKTELSLVEYEDLGTMVASWYGPGFHGRTTANGDSYDQMAYTVAHKTLKFGTLLKITNPRNNRSVVLRVNDRGPYIEGRELDLSKAAAHELGLIKKGVARVKVEKVKIIGLSNFK